MKTTIRNFITIGVLAFVANLGANASVINKNVKNSMAVETEKNLKNIRPGDCLMISSENLTSLNFSATENLYEQCDFQKEAQLITKQIVDREEAKAVQKVMSRNSSVLTEGNDSTELLDYWIEAQLITKTLADQAESNAISKLVAEGKL